MRDVSVRHPRPFVPFMFMKIVLEFYMILWYHIERKGVIFVQETKDNISGSCEEENKGDFQMVAEHHIIRPKHPQYAMLTDFCMLSRNLFNQANYLMRQKFFAKEPTFNYYQLEKITKANTEYTDYKRMPTDQTAQQTLKKLVSGWNSYRKAHRDWTKHPEKYLGEPKPPRYKKAGVGAVLLLTNQNCKIKNGADGQFVSFPKTFGGFKSKTKGVGEKAKFHQVRAFRPTTISLWSRWSTKSRFRGKMKISNTSEDTAGNILASTLACQT